ncbi:hypothetical protein LTR94_027319, partial [Friedmanniomyces endolithicus]
MGVFSSIWDKITGHKPKAPKAPPAASPAAAPQATAPAPIQPAAPAPAPAQPMASVDVEVVLSDLAETKGGGGNWRTSIVDLLKLLDLDSSLAARKALAQELNVNAGEHGSAEQNIAL